MNRERGLLAVVIGVSSVVCGAVGWLVGQLFVHLHTAAPSGHPTALRHTPRDERG
jgi:hypothetical protein